MKRSLLVLLPIEIDLETAYPFLFLHFLLLPFIMLCGMLFKMVVFQMET